jgi:hypothetical protein
VDPETGIVDQLGKSVDCLKWLPSGCSSDTDWRATNASSAMRPGDRHRWAQFREQLELVGVVHTPGDQAASRVASASGQRGSDRLHHWEAVQVLCRPAAPVFWFDAQRRHAHRLRGLRGRSPVTDTAVEQRFLGRQIQLVDQPVHRRTAIDPQQPLDAPNSPSCVPRLRVKEVPDTNHRAR